MILPSGKDGGEEQLTLLYTLTNQLNGSSVVTQDIQNLNIDTFPYKKILLEIYLLGSNDTPYYLVGGQEMYIDHLSITSVTESKQMNVWGIDDNSGFVQWQSPSYPDRITRVRLNSMWGTWTGKVQLKVYGIK